MRPQYGYALLAYVHHLSQNSEPDARGHCPPADWNFSWRVAQIPDSRRLFQLTKFKVWVRRHTDEAAALTVSPTIDYRSRVSLSGTDTARGRAEYRTMGRGVMVPEEHHSPLQSSRTRVVKRVTNRRGVLSGRLATMALLKMHPGVGAAATTPSRTLDESPASCPP